VQLAVLLQLATQVLKIELQLFSSSVIGAAAEAFRPPANIARAKMRIGTAERFMVAS
jgi:hypothetical protein